MSKYPKDRDNNVKIFQDTLHKIRKLHKPDGIRYNGTISKYNIDPVSEKEVCIEIENVNCMDKCIELSCKYDNIMLLNMASEFCPGGGVKKGSSAQEESICRCTSLYPTISFHRYPLSPCECIFSPKVFIVKDGNYNDIEPVQISVLSMASIRRPKLLQGNYDNYNRQLMKQKINMLLQTAHYHKQKVLVLGAWGCGAFYNPEHEVALLFKEQLDGQYKFAFEKVVFAILESDQSEPLGIAFKKTFCNSNKQT